MTVQAPARYDRFDQMPIAGHWRTGRSDTTQPDLVPYTGDTILSIRLATEEDLNDAYRGRGRGSHRMG
jgi:aldehyde dehydrogenase (NAD+)